MPSQSPLQGMMLTRVSHAEIGDWIFTMIIEFAEISVGARAKAKAKAKAKEREKGLDPMVVLGRGVGHPGEQGPENSASPPPR